MKNAPKGGSRGTRAIGTRDSLCPLHNCFAPSSASCAWYLVKHGEAGTPASSEKRSKAQAYRARSMRPTGRPATHIERRTFAHHTVLTLLTDELPLPPVRDVSEAPGVGVSHSRSEGLPVHPAARRFFRAPVVDLRPVLFGACQKCRCTGPTSASKRQRQNFFDVSVEKAPAQPIPASSVRTVVKTLIRNTGL